MLGEPSTGAALEFFSPTRQMLLVAIKNMGEATTEQLARETYLSAGAVRAHLLTLEAQGLVSFDRVRDGPGRPRHVFRLTHVGQRLFPQRYAEMANNLFSAIEEEDPAVVERVLERLVEGQAEMALASLESATLPERLQELAGFVDRYGFFSSLEFESDVARLTLRHCPLLSVATRHPGVCAVECRAMKLVLPGVDVERTEHRLDGDELCVYTIAWPAQQEPS